MRISDWSSDVCSSDLLLERAAEWLRPGGVLVYAACSLEAEESEVIAAKVALSPLPIGADELPARSEAHTSELPSLMRISYPTFCLKTKTNWRAKKNTYVHK